MSAESRARRQAARRARSPQQSSAAEEGNGWGPSAASRKRSSERGRRSGRKARSRSSRAPGGAAAGWGRAQRAEDAQASAQAKRPQGAAGEAVERRGSRGMGGAERSEPKTLKRGAEAEATRKARSRSSRAPGGGGGGVGPSAASRRRSSERAGRSGRRARRRSSRAPGEQGNGWGRAQRAYLPLDLAADGRARPTAQDRREHPRLAPRHDHVDGVGRAELRHRLCELLLARTVGTERRSLDPAGIGGGRGDRATASPSPPGMYSANLLFCSSGRARVVSTCSGQTTKRTCPVGVLAWPTEAIVRPRLPTRPRAVRAVCSTRICGPLVAGKTETTSSSGSNPFSTCMGAQGLRSSHSANASVYFIGVPRVERSVPPGRAPPTLRMTRRSARPMAAFARLPCPIAPICMFMPRRWRMGPFTIHRRSRAHRRRPHAVGIELLGAAGFDRRDDDRQVLGLTARHDRVDRHLLDGRRREVRGDDRNQVLSVPRGAREHAQDALGGRGDHGEAVGQPLVVQEFVQVVVTPDFDPAGAERAPLGLRRQALGDAGLHRTRATPPAATPDTHPSRWPAVRGPSS